MNIVNLFILFDVLWRIYFNARFISCSSEMVLCEYEAQFSSQFFDSSDFSRASRIYMNVVMQLV